MKIETIWIIFLTFFYICGIMAVTLGFLFLEIFKSIFKK